MALSKEMEALRKEERRKFTKRQVLNREFYMLRSILGNCSWAIFLMLLGGREAGKSYSVTDFYVKQWKQLKRPFYWLRLTETSQKKLLNNNAEKLIDPDLRRKYDLDLFVNGDVVYEVTERDETGKILKKEKMARVMALSVFYSDKGSGIFDKDFLNDPNMYYNICLDEMNRELNERKSFDIVYAFTNQLENIVRSTKTRLRVICIGNTLEEASDILCAFNFIPEDFGRFYLRKKRCVIEYMEPTEKYLERRKGTVADILMPTASTFTNKVTVDASLVLKKRLEKPRYVIKFNKMRSGWFTIWNDNIVAKYNGEKSPVIAMTRYLDEVYNLESRNAVIEMFDTRTLKYKDLITFKQFQKELELIKTIKSS